MLHTVNKSPFERTALECCLRYAQKGDSILFYEDGVVAARKASAAAIGLEGVKDYKLYVLGPDLEARGIAADQVMDGIEIVDYGGFVDLVAEVGPVQAWL